nr:GATA zinc finger domain-containing protein 4-like [Onthophagus taurus]
MHNIQEVKQQTNYNFKQVSEQQTRMNQEIISNCELNKQNSENIEHLKIKEYEDYENVKKLINEIKTTRNNVINVDSPSTIPYLKPEMWPKFNGYHYKIHPMTYLQNIQKLTQDLQDEKTVMNLVRLTLNDRALEWFEMVSEKCSTFQDFSREFINQFWNRSQQDQLRVELLAGTYKDNSGSRENYACKLYNKCKYIYGLDENTIAMYLLSHFRTTDNNSVLCQTVRNMNELIEILRRLDTYNNLTKLNPNNNNNNNKNYQYYRDYNYSKPKNYNNDTHNIYNQPKNGQDNNHYPKHDNFNKNYSNNTNQRNHFQNRDYRSGNNKFGNERFHNSYNHNNNNGPNSYPQRWINNNSNPLRFTPPRREDEKYLNMITTTNEERDWNRKPNTFSPRLTTIAEIHRPSEDISYEEAEEKKTSMKQ